MILNMVDVILQYTYCSKSDITPSQLLHSTKLPGHWKCTVLYILPRPLFAKTLNLPWAEVGRLDNVETEKCFAVVVGWCRSYPVRVSLRVKQSSGQRAYLLICHPRRSIKSHQHTGLWLGLLSLYFRIRVVVNGPLRRTRSTCVISEWLVCTLASYCSDRIIMTLTMTI